MSDDRTCPHGKPINHDCGLCDLGQGAISRGPDPRDAEIARLREDVARLTAALAVHREAVLAAEWQQGGGVKLCGDDLVCGAMIWERKGVEMRDEHIPDCRIGRALADPDGTAALEWVRGLEAEAAKAEPFRSASIALLADRQAIWNERDAAIARAEDAEALAGELEAASGLESRLLAEAIRERDEARDCGQDGVCAISPGCQRHWLERNGELLRERDEARRVAVKVWEVASGLRLTAIDEARLSRWRRELAQDPQPAPAHPRREPSLCSMTAEEPQP